MKEEQMHCYIIHVLPLFWITVDTTLSLTFNNAINSQVFSSLYLKIITLVRTVFTFFFFLIELLWRISHFYQQKEAHLVVETWICIIRWKYNCGCLWTSTRPIYEWSITIVLISVGCGYHWYWMLSLGFPWSILVEWLNRICGVNQWFPKWRTNPLGFTIIPATN